MKDVKKTYLELFLNKMLKSGKKYKYFLTIKNLIRIYGFIYQFFAKKKNKIWHPNALSKRQLIRKSSGYTFIKKIIKKKKKFKKIITVSKLDEKQNVLKEWFKLISLVIYKLPVRTFELKLFYFAYIINNKKIKKWKMFKKLSALYYKNVKSARKTVRKIYKRPLIKSNNENNIRKSLLVKYKRYFPDYHYRNKWWYLKRGNAIRYLYSSYWVGRRLIRLNWRPRYSVNRKLLLRYKRWKSLKKKKQIKKQLKHSNLKLPYNYYIHEINFFKNSFYKLNRFLKKKRFMINYKVLKKHINSIKKRWSICRLKNALKRVPIQYYIYRKMKDVFYFSPKMQEFCKRLRRFRRSSVIFNFNRRKKRKIAQYFWKSLRSNLIDFNKEYIKPITNKSYIIYNNTFFKIFYTSLKKYILTLKSNVITKFFKNKIKAEKRAKIKAKIEARENAEEKVLDREVDEILYGITYDDGFTGEATEEDIAIIEEKLMGLINKKFSLKKFIKLIKNCFNIVIRKISLQNFKNKLKHIYRPKINKKFKKKIKKSYKEDLKNLKNSKLIYYFREFLLRKYADELYNNINKNKGIFTYSTRNIHELYGNKFYKMLQKLRSNIIKTYKRIYTKKYKRKIFKKYNLAFKKIRYFKTRLRFTGYIPYLKRIRYKRKINRGISYIRRILKRWEKKKKLRELNEMYSGRTPEQVEQLKRDMALLEERRKKEEEEYEAKNDKAFLPELDLKTTLRLKRRWELYRKAVLDNIEKGYLFSIRSAFEEEYNEAFKTELTPTLSTLTERVKKKIAKASVNKSADNSSDDSSDELPDNYEDAYVRLPVSDFYDDFSDEFPDDFISETIEKYNERFVKDGLSKRPGSLDEGSERESDCDSDKEIDENGVYKNKTLKAILNRKTPEGMKPVKRLISGRYYLVNRPEKNIILDYKSFVEKQFFELVEKVQKKRIRKWNRLGEGIQDPKKLKKILDYRYKRDNYTDPRIPPKIPKRFRLKQKKSFKLNNFDDIQKKKK